MKKVRNVTKRIQITGNEEIHRPEAQICKVVAEDRVTFPLH